MVTTVRDSGVKNRDHIPEPGHREVGAHEKRSKPNGPSDGHNVLDRVGINGDNTSWSSPLMMYLVTMFVEFWMMEKPGCTQEFIIFH